MDDTFKGIIESIVGEKIENEIDIGIFYRNLLLWIKLDIPFADEIYNELIDYEELISNMDIMSDCSWLRNRYMFRGVAI